MRSPSPELSAASSTAEAALVDTHPRVAWPLHDRRAFKRLESPKVLVSDDWDSVVDISLGGACLRGAKSVEVGDRLTVLLTDAVLFHTAILEAEVRWHEEDRVGLRWVAVDPEALDWLKKRFTAGTQLFVRGWSDAN